MIPFDRGLQKAARSTPSPFDWLITVTNGTTLTLGYRYNGDT